MAKIVKIIVQLSLLFLTFCLAYPVFSDELIPNTVSVTGKGTIAIPADLAQVKLSITLHSNNYEEIDNLLSEKNKKVISSLEDHKANNIQTHRMQIYPVLHRSKDSSKNANEAKEYIGKVHYSFESDTDKTGEIIHAAMKAGVNAIDSINYTAKPEAITEARQEALKVASKDALKQVKIISDSMDLDLDEIISIETIEEPYHKWGRASHKLHSAKKRDNPLAESNVTYSISAKLKVIVSLDN